MIENQCSTESSGKNGKAIAVKLKNCNAGTLGRRDSLKLYDHLKDPQENVNLVQEPQYSQIAGELAAAMDDALSNGNFE